MTTSENHARECGFYDVPKDKPYDMTEDQHTAYRVGKQQREWFELMERDITGLNKKDE